MQVLVRSINSPLGYLSLPKTWTPLSISGCYAWYDLSDIFTLFQDSARTIPVVADGDVIGGVSDKTVNEKHLVQGTTANKPMYKVSIQNGKSIGRWNGINNIMSSVPITLPIQIEIFLLIKVASGNAAIILEHSVNSNGFNDGFYLARGSSQTLNYCRSGIFRRFAATNVDWVETGSFSLTSLYFSTDSFLFLNSVSVPGTYTYTIPVNSNTNQSLYFGARSGLVAPCAFDLGECLIYPTLSVEDRALVKSYLQNKWSV